MISKRFIHSKLLYLLIFSGLGIFSYLLLLYQTELSEKIPDMAVAAGGLAASIIVFNIFGFILLYTAKWMGTNYPLYYTRQQRLWWHYIAIACLLILINYAIFISLKWIMGAMHPFTIRPRGIWLMVAIWFAEMVIISLLLAINSMRYTLKLYREKQRLESDSIKAKYTALQNQLNPHFLFNSLNTLIAEIEYDPTTAVKFTQHLSEVYRYVLQCQQRQTITVKEEMDFLSSYVYLHQVRLGDCLQLECRITETAADCKIPPLTLQLLAENVVKHNYINENMPIVIHVYTDDSGEILRFSNTMRPKKTVFPSGKGLENLSERYRLLCGKEIGIKNNGEEFTVTIPLIND